MALSQSELWFTTSVSQEKGKMADFAQVQQFVKLEGVLPSKKDSASKPEDSIKKNGPNYLLIGVGVAAAAIIGYFIFKK